MVPGLSGAARRLAGKRSIHAPGSEMPESDARKQATHAFAVGLVGTKAREGRDHLIV